MLLHAVRAIAVTTYDARDAEQILPGPKYQNSGTRKEAATKRPKSTTEDNKLRRRWLAAAGASSNYTDGIDDDKSSAQRWYTVAGHGLER